MAAANEDEAVLTNCVFESSPILWEQEVLFMVQVVTRVPLWISPIYRRPSRLIQSFWVGGVSCLHGVAPGHATKMPPHEEYP